MIKFKCQQCRKSFSKTKSYVNWERMRSQTTEKRTLIYCSLKCVGLSQRKHKWPSIKCGYCKNPLGHGLYTRPSGMIQALRNSKSGFLFCNHSCAASYNNRHRINNTRISKLEIYLQNYLTKLLPKLNFKFNDRETIGLELDIYIPDLKLAFEINGIFHYQPIFGAKRLCFIQNNDIQKLIDCKEKKIDLIVIDVSDFKYFKEVNAQKYLNLVKSIIDEKLLSPLQDLNLPPLR